MDGLGRKREKMQRIKLLLGITIGASVCTVTSAQSVYVDLDIGSGPPSIGSGAPSSSFGGAAGVPGYWNRVQAGNDGPWALNDTSGAATDVSVSWTGDGGALGYTNPNTPATTRCY